jgi:hypothetical protein
MYRFLSFFLVLLFCTSSVDAAQCYTPDQFRAEQVVRYHSQMMVIGMLCGRPYKQNTYAAYQAFTKRHERTIRAEEDRLIAFFRQSGVASPTRALHDLRTGLANEMSMRAMNAKGAFCRSMVSRYVQAKRVDTETFRTWINTLSPDADLRSTRPVCAASPR